MSLTNDKFLNISNSIKNSYLEEWKNNKKKVLGYYCTYLPEELFYAAGLLPYRIRATGHELDELADIYMVRFTCGFVRLTLDLALRGGFDFLDGLFVTNCCDHARRMHELYDLVVFKRKEIKQKPPQFYVALPHVINEDGFEWYLDEIILLKEQIEQKYNLKEIDNSQLKEAINIYNENRSLLREIYNLRTLDNPKLTGSEFLQISMANTSVPKEIANNELRRILEIIKNSKDLSNNRKRIMLVGSVVDNINFTKLVEDSGAIIVSDFLCFGERNILDDVDLNGDLLENIANRTYYRMSCPRMMDDHERRYDFLLKEIERAKVDGVILQRINNCDLHGCENMLLEHELKDLGILTLNIDREAFLTDSTRLQTRIEAFYEMIK